jgi:hypothetical protein
MDSTREKPRMIKRLDALRVKEPYMTASWHYLYISFSSSI